VNNVCIRDRQYELDNERTRLRGAVHAAQAEPPYLGPFVYVGDMRGPSAYARDLLVNRVLDSAGSGEWQERT
jgi:hypothetical protein